MRWAPLASACAIPFAILALAVDANAQTALTKLPIQNASAPRTIDFETVNDYVSGGSDTNAIEWSGATELSPGNDEQVEDAGDGKCGENCGNPININTGNKIKNTIDFSSAGEIGLYLRLNRNRYWTYCGIFNTHTLIFTHLTEKRTEETHQPFGDVQTVKQRQGPGWTFAYGGDNYTDKVL